LRASEAIGGRPGHLFPEGRFFAFQRTLSRPGGRLVDADG